MNLIKSISLDEKKSIYILIFILIFHLLFLNLYPVNDEFIFPVGAKLIENFDVDEISLFFNYNANTLGFSLLIFFFSKFLPFDYYIIGKLLSCSGILLIYLAIFNLLKILKLNKIKDKHILILLIFFNPLIFIFSFRATPDFFASALSFFSIVYFLNNKELIFKFFFIILFSVAVIVKPFNAILIILIFIDFNFKSFFCKKNWNIFLWFLLSLLIPLFYFLYNYYLFNFFLIPDHFKLNRSFNIKDYSVRFLSYIGFLNIFLILLYIDIFFNSFIKNPFKILFYIIISILCSYFFMQNLGELNFGYLQVYLNPKIYFFTITLSFFIFSDFVLTLIKNNKLNKNLLILIALIIFFLIVLSNFQPTQRYLLSIITLSLFIFFIINKTRNLIFFTIIIYSVMNIPLFVNHYYTSKNIEKIIVFLNKNNILDDTHPGYIGQHSLNYFIDFEKDISKSMSKELLFGEKKYYVSDEIPAQQETIIFSTKSNNIFKKNKNLYLIKK